ncbi:MAG: amino acid adenylation domain-containing protein, partial [Acidobacteriota bacterium]
MQAIQDFEPSPLPIVDLRACHFQPREQELRRLVDEEALRPFYLGKGPLFRVQLLRLADQEYALLATMHHIVSDGLSVGILERELSILYEAFSSSRPSPLEELPIQYADFSHWQRSWLKGEVLQVQLDYWREQLSQSPLLEMPTDRPRPAQPTFRGAVEAFSWPAELTQSLKSLARSHNSTLFMTLLAGFQILLSRYSGQEDVSLGTPIANRNRAETEGLIGFFINTLVLRADLSGVPSFQQLLGRVRESALDAYDHQDVPFEKIVEELQPERSLTRTPLFQVMFVLQNIPRANQKLSGMEVSPLGGLSSSAKFDLTLAMAESDTLEGVLEYSTDLFEASTIQRLLRHFETLSEAVVADPGRSLTQLPLLSAAERHQLLREWNDLWSEYPRQAAISQLFEAQAERGPDRVAASFEGEELSYGEFNRRANQLGHGLRKLNVAPDELVGVFLQRSLEMTVAMVGILKAGGAYLPLDPGYPPDRLSLMLSDAGSRVVLTQRPLSDRLPKAGVHRICLGRDWGAWVQEPSENLDPRAGAGNLAYVIYTSGSTGVPKGVAVPQQAVVRLVLETDYVRLTPQDRVAQIASSSFDAATFEIWGALLQGGRLVGVPRDVVLSPRDLAAHLRNHQISALFLTTTVFNQAAAEAPWAFDSVRHLLVGGEAVDPRWVRRILEEGGPQRILNGYGPTESTTFACWHPVREVEDGAVTVPIGRPVANTTLHVLDRHLELVPAGVAGQLYIGGEGLARGYLNRPDLTADRFVPHPFGEGERLYQTGDVVRRRAEGSLEFVGRVDDQVKIRGFRIEPGEVEAVLGSHPAVGECAVLARGEGADRRLLAYLVSERPAGELQDFLKKRLPSYMVPSGFVMLEALPLTPNGKVDRRALMQEEALEPVAEYAVPLGPTQELLAGIWSDVLEVEAAGGNDHFFDLGGHSLLATQVISRIRRAFEVELALRVIFEAPVLSALAGRIDEARRLQQGESPVPPLRRVSRQAELPLSFAQQRLWFLDQLEPNSPIYNIPTALRLNRALKANVLEAALNEVLRRHEALRTCFPSVEGNPQQVIREFQLSVPVVDLRACPDDQRRKELERLANQAAVRPFDLSRVPLLRAHLVQLGDEDCALLVNMHHILSDGWSMGILEKELPVIYDAFAWGRPSPLEELPIQYADFAHWQRSWLRGDVLKEQLGFWVRTLQGAPPTLELPADHPRPALPTYRGANFFFEWPARLGKGLKALARKEDATLFMALLAAFQVLLSRYSGQGDISLGTPIANRNRTEIEGLIGFFVNTLVLRSDLSDEPSFLELLRRVREAALDAYAHQDVPFEQVVEALQPERSLSRAPLFQVMFILQNAPGAQEGPAPLEVSAVAAETSTSKFDLTLAMAEAGEGLAGSVTYSLDLFEAATIRRLLGHLQNLVESILLNPEQRVSRLSLLSDNEKQQLLREWNATQREFPQTETLAGLFAIQAKGRPDAVAVVCGREALSYGALYESAQCLAVQLERLGVGPEGIVGILSERSLEMLAGLVGILEAGGAYLPLEPSHPPQRLAFMLEDAGAKAVLVQEHMLNRLPAGGPRILCLGQDWPYASPKEPGPAAHVQPQNLAYVIYTSGSTGRPKGVAVAHTSVVRLVMNANFAELTPSDHVSHASNVAFDVAAFEVWGALLHGARLEVIPRETLLSPPEFASSIRQREVSVLNLTPALFSQFVREDPSTFESVRDLMLAGEALDPAPVREVLRSGSPQRFLNVYGPTENATFSSWYEVEEVDEKAARIPIGAPISNTQAYVLDGRLEAAPIGVPGELHLGGPGLARAYFNRPGLTADKFIPNPFRPSAGERLYKTGDLV